MTFLINANQTFSGQSLPTSTRVSQQAIIKTEPHGSTPLLIWLYGSKEIRIIVDKEGLKFKSLDSEKEWTGPIDCGGRSIEKAILGLAKLDVTIQGNDVVFSKLPECEGWPVPFVCSSRKELKLVWKNKQCTWRVFDKDMKTITLIKAGSDAIKILRSLNNLVEMDRISYLEDFEINLKKDLTTKKLLNISIKKICKPSKLDPSKSINRDKWSITLIVAGHSKYDPKSWYGHVLISYESIEKGKQYLHYAHLINHKGSFPQVQIIDRETLHHDIEIRSKSETWVRKRYWANLMIKKIGEENGKPHSFRFIPPFRENLLDKIGDLCCGKRIHPSIKCKPLSPTDSSEGDNCLTWAIQTLTYAGIKLPPIDILSAWPIPVSYIQKLRSKPSLVTFTPDPE